MVIGLVGAASGATTTSLFSDTETSEDNTFTTGALDLKVDWEESYNGEKVDTQPKTDNPGTIFEFSDIKPGDHGEATVSLHQAGNPGYVWLDVNQTANKEVVCTEPEKKAEGGDCGEHGELGDKLDFIVWNDDGDNIRQDDEEVIFNGSAHELAESNKGVLLDGDSSKEGKNAFDSGQTEYIGIKWKLPIHVGNEVQRDSKKFDFEFYTEQKRHNDVTEHEEEKEDTYYQVDFVGGEPIEDLSKTTYHEETRMQRFLHGGPENPIERQEEEDQVKTGEIDYDCVDSQPMTVDTSEDTATVDFKVNDHAKCSTGTQLSLVSYKKNHAGWVPEKAAQQEIFDNKTVTLDPGNHSMTVEIPDVN